MSRQEFVKECGKLLNIAKPSLLSCELVLGKDMPKRTGTHYIEGDEYVLIACKNGHTYGLPVDGNSLIAIAEEIFSSMAHK
jgi:hypothetical protein